MISRILTVQRLAMCCGPVYLQPWMPCEGAWFRHGCFCQRTLWEHERYYGLGMDALVSICSGTVNVILFEHGCFGQRMLPEQERYSGLSMDALVSVCSRDTNVIMVWAWMLSSAHALGTRTLLWFGHGCFGQRMLWEHERYYGLGMAALVSVCSQRQIESPQRQFVGDFPKKSIHKPLPM